MGPDGEHGGDGVNPGEQEAALLRGNLFSADLLQLPPPEQGLPDFLPEGWTGTLPVLVFPPLSERGVKDGDTINLEVTPFHIYFGALRELAECADSQRADQLRRSVLHWNPHAALEVVDMGRQRIQEDIESALLHYELAAELDPDLYEAAQDGGMCQYALATLSEGEPEERDERLAAAEELFRRAVQLQPGSGLSWWSLARTLHDRGAPEEALDLLRLFLLEYPEGSERELVEQALTQGFAPLSTWDATEAPAEPPAASDPVRIPDADPAQTVELLRPLAEQNPNDAALWFALGQAHRALWAAAAEDSADSRDPMVRARAEEAERCLRRAARLAPEEPFVWYELARTCNDLQEWRAAEDALRRALALDPQNALYYEELAAVLQARGDLDAAREALEVALQLVPDDPQLLAALNRLAQPAP